VGVIVTEETGTFVAGVGANVEAVEIITGATTTGTGVTIGVGIITGVGVATTGVGAVTGDDNGVAISQTMFFQYQVLSVGMVASLPNLPMLINL
jgi:hypothetical protein